MSAGTHTLAINQIVPSPGEVVPKQYSQMVVSRMQDAGVQLDAETLAAPECAAMGDLLSATAVAGVSAWLLFAQSPELEATLAIASSAT